MNKTSCKHHTFRDIYKAINFHGTFCKKGGQEFTCSHCGTKCILKWKGCRKMRKPSLKNFLTYLLWLLPAAIFVCLFVRGYISPRTTIGLTIVYHFVAMWGIINYSSHIKVVEKK